MKIAFLGKGGSGKSTLATAATRYAHAKGNIVLAIDTDYNMDLSYNLGHETLPHYLGTDPHAIKEYLDVSRDTTFLALPEHAQTKGLYFSLNPRDEFTRAHSVVVDNRLYLMAAGPHTDTVRKGDACSHSLSAPLKAYLPLLNLKSDEIVVIDERASTDPVATGILHSATTAFIVVESTPHSIRVGQLIAQELTHHDIPYAFVGNKTTESSDFSQLPKTPITYVPYGGNTHTFDSSMEKLFAYART